MPKGRIMLRINRREPPFAAVLAGNNRTIYRIFLDYLRLKRRRDNDHTINLLIAQHLKHLQLLIGSIIALAENQPVLCNQRFMGQPVHYNREVV
ncbi:hypothetical protein D3C75_787130 [compost metagenome]